MKYNFGDIVIIRPKNPNIIDTVHTKQSQYDMIIFIFKDGGFVLGLI